MATVAPALTPFVWGTGAAGAVGAAGDLTVDAKDATMGTVDAMGDITAVLASAGSTTWLRAFSRASTNASQVSQRAFGSLAIPRMTTASTSGPSSGRRELGVGG